MPRNTIAKQLRKDLIASVGNTQPVQDVIVGLNLTAVQSRYLGIASTVSDQKAPFIKIENAGRLQGVDVNHLIKKLGSNSSLESSLGMAALNSTIGIPKSAEELNAYKIIEEKGSGKNIAVIGHFPFVDRLKKISKNCWVFEQKPRSGDQPAEALFSFLPESDVVVITGQTILNDTIGHILAEANHAFRIMLGPSTPLNTVLFDYEIDVIGGTFIRECDAVKKYIAQAAHYRELPGLVKLVLRK